MEAELVAINQRLDHITSLLPPTQPSTDISDGLPVGHSQGNHGITDQERSPFQLLGTDCMMTILGLGPGFAQELVRLERETLPVGLGNAPRLRIIQQQQALAALAAFSAYIHVWYPVLRPGFSQRYLSIISGPLMTGPESCLVLLVAATGVLAQQDHALGGWESDSTSELYLEAALVSLPAVLIDSGIVSVQCLILLSIYHCCLCKPCQAYDYVMIASFKVQNLLKCLGTKDGELYEHAKRAYWAVLLLESELRVQFDVVDSGIWNHDDHIELPDSRHTWQFDIDTGSPLTTATSPPASILSDENATTDKTQSYFLAEISMRRMLHRCNTAIRRTSRGEIVYAPAIALELELQLNQWYSYLPDLIRFDCNQDLDFDLLASPSIFPQIDPLSNFLRVQYYCCKISIYWPAVYQCIQDGAASPEVLEHCERFFHAYVQLMPSILMSVRHCIVNRWTLYASIFMTSMAAMQAALTPCLREAFVVDWSRLLGCFRATRTVDQQIIQASPSLSLLNTTLAQRWKESYSALGGTED